MGFYTCSQRPGNGCLLSQALSKGPATLVQFHDFQFGKQIPGQSYATATTTKLTGHGNDAGNVSIHAHDAWHDASHGARWYVSSTTTSHVAATDAEHAEYGEYAAETGVMG